MIKSTTKWICCINLLAVTASFCWQLEANAQAWPNEPPNSTVLTDCNMIATCSGWVVDAGSPQYVTDSTTTSAGTASPTTVLRNTHTGGTAPWGGSGAQLIYNIAGAPRELYVGFWVKQSNPFAGYPTNNANKIVFIKTNTQYQALEFYGANQSSYPVVWSWTTDGTNNNGHIGGCAAFDNCWLFGSGQQWPVGSWHRVEFYLRFGTNPSSNNGIVRWWVDGTQVGNYTNVNFPGSYFEFLDLTHTWDGATTNLNQFSFSFDHFRVSLPGGSGGGGTTPPAAPTGLTIR